MRDLDIRRALRSALTLHYQHDAETRIVEEMGIWSGSVRIDLVAINCTLHGYELKSARDTLARLPAQATLYNKIFDYMTIVCAKRHLQAMLNVVPDWWGIIIACPRPPATIALCRVRSPLRNASLDAVHLARLLWRSEALALLERYRIDRGFRSRNTEALIARLAEKLPLNDLAYHVRTTLKRRENWLGEPIRNERKVAIQAV